MSGLVQKLLGPCLVYFRVLHRLDGDFVPVGFKHLAQVDQG